MDTKEEGEEEGGGGKKERFFFFFFFPIKFTESAAFCRVGRVTGNNNKFLLGLVWT